MYTKKEDEYIDYPVLIKEDEDTSGTIVSLWDFSKANASLKNREAHVKNVTGSNEPLKMETCLNNPLKILPVFIGDTLANIIFDIFKTSVIGMYPRTVVKDCFLDNTYKMSSFTNLDALVKDMEVTKQMGVELESIYKLDVYNTYHGCDLIKNRVITIELSIATSVAIAYIIPNLPVYIRSTTGDHMVLWISTNKTDFEEYATSLYKEEDVPSEVDFFVKTIKELINSRA